MCLDNGIEYLSFNAVFNTGLLKTSRMNFAFRSLALSLVRARATFVRIGLM